MTTEMTEKIYNALNGDYQERDWETLMQRRNFRKGRNVARFYENERPFLEAMVLIPEDEGLATVEMQEEGCDTECSIPKYKSHALDAIFAACARKFSEPAKLSDKYRLLFYVNAMMPEEMQRCQNHRDHIIAGINNSKYAEHGFRYDDEAMNANLTCKFEQMGFSGAKDTDVVQALWNKSKESTSGFLDGFSWKFFSNYLLEHNPEIVTSFDYIRKGLANRSLSNLLISVPVNPAAETNDWDRKRRGMPEEKVWKPILEYIDNAITDKGK